MIADIFIYVFTTLFVLTCVFGAIDFYKNFKKK